MTVILKPFAFRQVFWIENILPVFVAESAASYLEVGHGCHPRGARKMLYQYRKFNE
jgi:hypothetical protein